MKQKIKWKRDISDRTVEALSGGKPLSAVPQQEGDLSCEIQNWSYKKDTITLVELQEVSDHRPCAFIDLETGQTVSGIPRDAFDLID